MKNYLLIILLALLSNTAYSDANLDSQLKLAKQGDAEAQWILGSRYQGGLGVPEKDKTAVIWYTKSAEQGYIDAQYNLGLMYANGEGVQQDYKTAVMWYTKAAEQGLGAA